MINCDECDKETNPAFGCDEAGMWFCIDCFEKLDCEELHGEGCLTVAWENI